MLTINTKMVYHACVLSTLLYGNEAWTVYPHQHRYLRRLLGLIWQDHVTNIDVLANVEMASMHSMLTTRSLRLLGHVSRIFGELASSSSSSPRSPRQTPSSSSRTPP